ncbi:MAG: transposase [Ectothiorhodospiraceae bacterium]|nr:transposase [Chromatiales bacterium]MCP5157337.1 transposase [Ectothiorhodospiraceae bacterium]
MPLAVFDLPWWGYVLVTLAMTHLTIIGVTLFLHRAQAHRAVDLHPAVSHVLRLWLWLSTGMDTKQWVAVHRKHHAKVEGPEDPHSPIVHGIRKVLLEGAELYRVEARRAETLERYGHGTPDDWLERNVYSRHSGKGFLLMLLIDVVLFGPIGLTIWAVQMAWIPLFAAGVINGVGHYKGYRNFETADTSSNIVPIGILIGGEELHNNHHAFASSARFSSRWWELDIGWLYIRVLQAVGLARVKKLPPQMVILPYKAEPDHETVSAVIANRFHVMAEYATTVVQQVVAEELSRADASRKRLLRSARQLIVRDESLLTADAREHLEHVLAGSQTLETVYRYKQELRRIWQERSASHERLLQSLQQWCKEAEETGIRSLQEFARTLPTYALARA